MYTYGFCTFCLVLNYFTGYKQREKIRKALQARSEAIRKALERYNSAAKALTPPREPLTWAAVIELVQLGEFTLLRDSRQDIRAAKWTQPLNREAARLYFEIKRAREEIIRCNVEIRRQITFMVDNFNDHLLAISDARTDDPNLAVELQRRLDYQLRIDKEITWRFAEISQMHGFTGSLLPGTRIGREPFKSTDQLPPWAMDILGMVLEYGEVSITLQGMKTQLIYLQRTTNKHWVIHPMSIMFSLVLR
ncbi:hypothetical protein FISHEDRAFT_37442 [Fistulina hepatica ATCC 64428]|uniref:Uncharacterized protein n=1 Tax=Fistulina hepatica ATCC 64428 TaxID=1128425 RepID=A0A0D7AHR1_9AGAR|nr:hypothetical protein FISHEDRAFT_37442 [Fistulina hepatica ATCC 64428]